MLIADARPSVKLASTVPFSVTDGSGTVTPLPAGEIVLKPDLKVVVDGKPGVAARPARIPAGQGRNADARRQGLSRRAAGDGRAEGAPGDRRRRPRRLPARCRPGRDAEGLAGRRAAGPGRRRPLVRAREHRQEPALRPLLRHAQPGVLRRRGASRPRRRPPSRRRRARSSPTAARWRRRSTTRPRAAARPRARDVFGVERPLSPGRRRPLGHALAVPPLGAARRSPPRRSRQAFGLSAPVVDVVGRSDRLGPARLGHARQEDRRPGAARRPPTCGRGSASGRRRSGSACSASAGRRSRPPRASRSSSPASRATSSRRCSRS